MLPSRNRPASKPVTVSDKSGAADEDVAEVPAEPPRRPVGDRPSKRAPASASVIIDELVKTTIHFGSEEDRFLDEVNFAGKRARPKVDASRSAVARLALRRLAEQMTSDEIVDELRRRAPTATATGRKRL
jgi:hypothetical protein